ncbi:MAG: DinB family protein [Crocinitomicaceae bacterium]
MTLTQQIAKHLRDVHYGGNWTASNLKDALSDLNWQEATSKVDDFNTIAVLTFHVSYYLDAIIDVVEGRPLTTKDELSFLCPDITSEGEWSALVQSVWDRLEKAASLVEELDDEILSTDFSDKKYGSYFRNVHGLIEHTHYHLGQIVILKRLVRKSN